MSPEEHLDKIQRTLDYVATLQRSHDEQIDRLVEQGDRNERDIATLAPQTIALTERTSVLTERTIQAMDAENRLARIADIREDRIDFFENPPQ